MTIERRRAIRAEIRGASRLSSRFLILNSLAAVIAAYGLLLNSPATVIGSVVLAQELGPIMGISLALNDGDLRLLRRSLVSEAEGIALILAITLAIGWLHRSVPTGAEIMTRVSPTIMDLAVALAAGAAGAYASTSARVSQAIVGVAITTSLLPPLAASGLLLARGEERLAIGAALLFLTNLVAIQFAARSRFTSLGCTHGSTTQKIKRTCLEETPRRSCFCLRSAFSCFSTSAARCRTRVFAATWRRR